MALQRNYALPFFGGLASDGTRIYSSGMSKKVLHACTGVAASIVSFFSFQLLDVPCIAIGLAWLLAFAFYMFTCTSHLARIVWFNFALMTLALTACESFLWIRDKIDDDAVAQHDLARNRLIQLDDMLGFRPIKNAVDPSVKRHYEGKLLYDVKYTIGPDQLRKNMPEHIVEDPIACVLFFGGSFTFGEGVNDHETMPSQVGQLSGFRHQLYNFGFVGYGPHQMLSALDHNLVSDIASSDGLHIAIYQAPLAHIQRSAGLADWDYHGPRYTLGPGDEAIFAGNFDDGRLRPFGQQGQKSYLADRMIAFRNNLRNWNVSLFIGIITTAKERFDAQFPGGEFHVLLWDDEEDPNNAIVIDALVSNGIPLHLVSRIFPHKGPENAPYRIPIDGHPNAIAHRILAQYVVDYILVKN